MVLAPATDRGTAASDHRALGVACPAGAKLQLRPPESPCDLSAFPANPPSVASIARLPQSPSLGPDPFKATTLTLLRALANL
jgi:hypothetical protein